jgi:hypothetical protein
MYFDNQVELPRAEQAKKKNSSPWYLKDAD